MVININSESKINIDVATQKLQLNNSNGVVFEATIATAKNGVGELYGSECTPRGQHIIRAKIGIGEPENTVFIARRSTGEIYSKVLKQQYPQRDWILTRVMWLSGLDINKNRLGKVDTMRRYIYIHGCPDEDILGTPSSHGCIKMHNKDVITLFDMVNVGTLVIIED
ncbi:Glutamate synthase [NADPH] large chain [hydrothermal vent metagenome]|uniref:Glutamate synthase [NADPH] large chain n=1 Tax=hydrothermal vent metagenome TaxID=652676 RepID=A0A3B1A5R8_9ZZZZ